MSILLLGAAFALNAAQPNYILNEPQWRGSTRGVLLECPPPYHGHAQLVTREFSAAPDFEISGVRILSRDSMLDNCSQPGPDWYGVPGAFARIHAWVGEVPIVFDPFDRLPEYAPGQLRRAQNLWLDEQGLVNQARLVRRAIPAPVVEEAEQGALPEPIMIIPKPEKKSTRDLPLEVHRLSPTRIMITDGSVLPPIETAAATK